MKKITNLKGAKILNKKERQSINGGGFGCPVYPSEKCLRCGGYPLPNGCCLGTQQTHDCLTGNPIS